MQSRRDDFATQQDGSSGAAHLKDLNGGLVDGDHDSAVVASHVAHSALLSCMEREGMAMK